MAGARRRPALPRRAWRARGIDLRLRYKSKAVDLVWPKQGCKVKLRAGRDRGSGRGEGVPEAHSVSPRLIVTTLP